MTREEIKNTPELVDFMLDKCVLADSRTKVRKRLEEVCDLAIKALEQEPCIQEKQANADKIDAVYIDGFKAGYSQARFDLEQQPCDDCISRQYLLNNCVVDKVTMPYVPVNKIKEAPPVTQSCDKCVYSTKDGYCQYDDITETIPPLEPTSEMVHVETLRQVMWERDIAIEQLHELGYELGQKIDSCDNAVSREIILSKIKEVCFSKEWTQFRVDNGSNGQRDYLINFIEKLPPVTQKPIECDDAVRRDVVKEQMIKYGFHAPDMTVTEFVEDLPPVTQKSKTGHWILQPSNKEQGERDFIWWKCSECGQVIFSETEKDRREYHAFCSRCGAEMENQE